MLIKKCADAHRCAGPGVLGRAGVLNLHVLFKEEVRVREVGKLFFFFFCMYDKLRTKQTLPESPSQPLQIINF